MPRLTIAMTALLAACATTPSREAPQVLPNIVLILADDLGWGDLTCYAATSKIDTPQLDTLAAAGVRFTDAHSPSAVCSPTRYGLLTGRYAWRSELQQSVVWEWGRPLIEPESVTLPELLGSAGYRTACIGKWHLGWTWLDADGLPANADVPFFPRGSEERGLAAARVDLTQPMLDGPTAHGFDLYFGDDVPNFPPRAWIENDRLVSQATEAKPKGMFGSPGPTTPGWDLAGVLPGLADHAVDFVEESHDAPFFLYLSLTAPHTPIAPAPDFVGTTSAGLYGDYVAEVDWVVGRVLRALEAGGHAENTLVIFSSDNGSPARDGAGMNGAIGSVTANFGHHPNGPWRGYKADIWEAGHRVPLIVRWPEVTPVGTTSSALVGLQDLYATLAEGLGIPVPTGEGADSQSFLDALVGEVADGRDALVHHSLDGTFGVRRGRWKLIPGNLGSGGFSKPARKAPGPSDPGGQLYDLVADPGETQNLWTQHAEVVAELEAVLAATRVAD